MSLSGATPVHLYFPPPWWEPSLIPSYALNKCNWPLWPKSWIIQFSLHIPVKFPLLKWFFWHAVYFQKCQWLLIYRIHRGCERTSALSTQPHFTLFLLYQCSVTSSLVRRMVWSLNPSPVLAVVKSFLPDYSQVRSLSPSFPLWCLAHLAWGSLPSIKTTPSAFPNPLNS